MSQRQALQTRWFATIVTLSILLGSVLPPSTLFAQVERPTNTPSVTDRNSTPDVSDPDTTDDTPEDIPEWLEPQGINVVDLVGLVPEAHLKDAVIAYTVAGGLLQYMEGNRNGDTVTIRAKVWPRFETYNQTRFNCVSLRPISDHWGVTAPAGTVRIFEGRREITDRIMQLDYFYAGLLQPSFPARSLRYEEKWYADLNRTDDGALILPANMGCTITLDGIWDSGNLTALFTFDAPQVISVETLGQETFTFRSYIGPGYAGKVAALQEQLNRFGKRHDKFRLNIPPEAEYVLVNYPTSPVSPYIVGDIERNIRTPSSGTYRLARGEATLSVDHNITMALPLHAQWQDADQAGDRFLKRIEGINMLASLEYFVPEGVEYDPCMQHGNCPDALMQRILDAKMEMTVYYYKVDRVRGGLTRIMLRQVGPEYGGATAAAAAPTASADEVASVGVWPATTTIPPRQIYLPLVTQPFTLLPDNPVDCPCGWFTPDGRMVDTIPEG